MTVLLTIPMNDASLERARAEAPARGVSVEEYLAELLQRLLPPSAPPRKGHVSSIFGLVKEGEPTDIARDKDKLIGEAVWQEYLEETKQK